MPRADCVETERLVLTGQNGGFAVRKKGSSSYALVANVGGNFKLDNLLIDEHDGSLVATDCVSVHPPERKGRGRFFMDWEEWEGVMSQKEWEEGAADVCTAIWRETVLDYTSRYNDWKKFAVMNAVDKAREELKALKAANAKEMEDLIRRLEAQKDAKVRNLQYHQDQMRRKKASHMERTTGKSKAEVKFILDEDDKIEMDDLLGSEEVRVAQRKLKQQRDHDALMRGGEAAIVAAHHLYD